MQTQLFISGKNWQLSLAELIAYFNTRQVKYKVEYFSREFFVLNFEENMDAQIIADLGGTIKIGTTKTALPTQTVKEAFLEKNKPTQKQIAQTLVQSGIVEPMAETPDKILFGVSIYFTDNAYHPYSAKNATIFWKRDKRKVSDIG